MAAGIDERLLLLLKEKASRADGGAGTHFAKRGFWKQLEEQTGISSGRWRNFFSGQQKAATDMVEAAAKLYPEYGFWLSTGITDSSFGHTAPTTVIAFPERVNDVDFYSRQYFAKSLELADDLIAMTGSWSELERTQIAGTWRGGAAVATAYELSKTEAYGQLRDVWESREEGLRERISRIRGEGPKSKVPGRGKRQDRMVYHDPRTRHQEAWDLFYTPNDKEA